MSRIQPRLGKASLIQIVTITREKAQNKLFKNYLNKKITMNSISSIILLKKMVFMESKAH